MICGDKGASKRGGGGRERDGSGISKCMTDTHQKCHNESHFCVQRMCAKHKTVKNRSEMQLKDRNRERELGEARETQKSYNLSLHVISGTWLPALKILLLT